MGIEASRERRSRRGSWKGRLAALAGVVAAVALFVGNVDKIWTAVIGWFGGKKPPQTQPVIIQITVETLVKAAAQASAIASAASGVAGAEGAEAAREASGLKVAAESLKAPISLGVTSNPIPLWLSIAFKEVGQKEIPGPKHNPRILEYIASVDSAVASYGDEFAWSSFFVNWALTQAQVPGTKSGLGQLWLTWGVALETPRPGAVAVFSHAGQPIAAHACFYVGETGDQVLCLSGNVANSVQISAIPKSGLLGYRWPKRAS